MMDDMMFIVSILLECQSKIMYYNLCCVYKLIFIKLDLFTEFKN